ncbi:MAG TPA: hypothetical protein P5266_07390 [Candidatus Fermentibacter sp.]|nr:hypothetical protein [Candidatus Fermentibacter sp.]
MFQTAAAVSIAISSSTIGPYLYVDLQDGFEGFRTYVYLEDSLVYRGAPETDPLTGLASGLELMGRSSVVEIRVRVPEISVDSTFSVDMQAGEFLGIGITGDGELVRRLSLVHSGVPFGYD